MKTIDAGTAKLAGLQIDMLQKIRNGQITVDHLEWFNNLSGEIRDSLLTGEKPVAKPAPAPSPEPTEKFALLVDLGIITVPADYDHATCLSLFRKKNSKKFYYDDKDITDAHFPNPSRILKPGDKLWVRAFGQIVPGSTSSEERIAFLATQNAVHTGAQGLAQVFEQKRDLLPKGKGYCSFDEKDLLWQDSVDYHRVPYLYAFSVGYWYWYLGNFERSWLSDCTLLCFCDLPVGETHLGA